MATPRVAREIRPHPVEVAVSEHKEGEDEAPEFLLKGSDLQCNAQEQSAEARCQPGVRSCGFDAVSSAEPACVSARPNVVQGIAS